MLDPAAPALSAPIDAAPAVDLGQTDKPVYLVDVDGHWQGFCRLIEHFDANRMLRPRARTGIRIVPSVEALFEAIGAA